MKKVMFVLIVAMIGCSSKKDTKVVTVPDASDPTSFSIDLASVQQDGLVLSEDTLNFPALSPALKESSISITLTNSSSEAKSVSVSALTAAGFSIKTNRCTASLLPKKNCAITLSFKSRGLYDGTYHEGMEIVSGQTTFALQLEGSISGQPDPENGTPNLQISLDKRFDEVSETTYRTLTISNIGTGPAKDILATLPSEYKVRLNRCPTSLAPGKSCYIQVLFKNFRHATPTSGKLVIAAVGLSDREIDLSSGGGNGPGPTLPEGQLEPFPNLLRSNGNIFGNSQYYSYFDNNAIRINNDIFFGYQDQITKHANIYKINTQTLVGSDQLLRSNGAMVGEGILFDSPESLFETGYIFDHLVANQNQLIIHYDLKSYLHDFNDPQAVADYLDPYEIDNNGTSRVLNGTSGVLLEYNKPVNFTFKGGSGQDLTFAVSNRYNFSKTNNNNRSLWEYNGKVYGVINFLMQDTPPEGQYEFPKAAIVEFTENSFQIEKLPNGRATSGMYDNCNNIEGYQFSRGGWNVVQNNRDLTMVSEDSYPLNTTCHAVKRLHIYDKRYTRRYSVDLSISGVDYHVVSKEHILLFEDYRGFKVIDRATGVVSQVVHEEYIASGASTWPNIGSNLKIIPHLPRGMQVFGSKIYFCDDQNKLGEIANYATTPQFVSHPTVGCDSILKTKNSLLVQYGGYYNDLSNVQNQTHIKSISSSGVITDFLQNATIIAESSGTVLIQRDLVTDLGNERRVLFHDGITTLYPWGNKSVKLRNANIDQTTVINDDYMILDVEPRNGSNVTRSHVIFKDGQVKGLVEILLNQVYSTIYDDPNQVLFINNSYQRLYVLDVN